MKDRLTEIWSQVHPVEAYTAGLKVDPELAGPVAESNRSALKRQVVAEAECCSDGEELRRTLLRAFVVELEVELSHTPLVEAVEWLRAVIFRGVSAQEAAEIEQALARRLGTLTVRIREANPLGKILCRTYLEALVELSASFESLRHEAQSLLSVAGTISNKSSLAEILGALSGSRDTSILTPQEHQAVLAEVYGFSNSVDEIENQALQRLTDELEHIRSLAKAIGRRLNLRDSAHLEAVVAELSRRRAKRSVSVLEEALRQTRLALPLFRNVLIDLREYEASVLPEPTPQALRSLVTEGQEYMVDALTPTPVARCFITDGECESVYTLANVLYHELAHCWNMLGAARSDAGLPAPVRASGPTGNVLLEGIAFHREWEVFELYREMAIDAQSWEYSELFDGVGASREEAIEEFELETRYWRLARFLRALFDARVHGGKQTYAEFLAEQATATRLDRRRIHRFCFHFMGKPGYAPCYAFGGMKVAALQREAEARGWTRRAFNTRLSRVGLLPPAFWRIHLGL